MFTFRVGLLTSFKLYKEPWANCVRSDFLRLIKSNHADHWTPHVLLIWAQIIFSSHLFSASGLPGRFSVFGASSAFLRFPESFRSEPQGPLRTEQSSCLLNFEKGNRGLLGAFFWDLPSWAFPEGSGGVWLGVMAQTVSWTGLMGLALCRDRFWINFVVVTKIATLPARCR